ncbi:CcmD family protein [Methanosarcina sp. KYL-1]|nr:CcmD family protein [Methanosarcina sp. KYL-1]
MEPVILAFALSWLLILAYILSLFRERAKLNKKLM